MLLTITTLKAQEKTNDSVFPKHIIKIHPLDAISGGIGLNYERVLAQQEIYVTLKSIYDRSKERMCREWFIFDNNSIFL